MAYKVPPLRSAYDALEAYIDAETMELHHDRHHQTYVNNVNKAIEPYPHLKDFGSFERFQSLFTDAAAKHFGSGWVFLASGSMPTT